MILMIDNYDSFTYNLVEYLKMLKREVKVYRNDDITIDKIKDLKPDMIVISPGPCTPNEAGISKEIIKKLKGKFPILGICLGHQTIADVFGGKIIKAEFPVHGKVYKITHDNKGIFKDLKNPIKVTRYHSLIVDKSSLPNEFKVTAQTDKGEIMGIRHTKYLISGLQFHPEAILTEKGLKMLKNFLEMSDKNDN